MRPGSIAKAAPYALFLGSGASGLVYQVIWVRQFGNIFGNSVHSAALVTAMFMGGLGLGSYLAGVWADRAYRRGPRPLLRAYGWAEIAIGCLGVALALLLPRLAGLSASLASYTRGANGFRDLAMGGELARHALAALVLAPMTLLMGGTLTLLIRVLVRGDLGRAGLRIGTLYGCNTAGAALGCFLTDFALVPSLGLLRTQMVSAALNLGVGAVAVALAARITAEGAPAEVAEEPSGVAETPTDVAPNAASLTAAALALTGFAGMGMEIVWFRFLSGAMGPYRSVFSLLLTVILLGICAGALLGGALHRRYGRPAMLYLIVEVLFVLATLGLLASFDRLAVDRHMARAFQAAGAPEAGLSTAAQAWAMLRAMALVVGLPSLLMGCTFPLANANIQRVEASVGRRAGALYLANTAGSVLGSMLAGFVLLPWLGAQGAVLALAAVAATAIIPLQLSTRRSLRDDRPLDRGDYVFAGGFLALALALSAWGMLLPADHLQRKSLPDSLGERFLTVTEGVNETVAVSVSTEGDRRLWTNGHSMSLTTPDAQRYMRAFSHLPLLQIDEPRSALVICFGVGNTVHAASLHPSVTRVDLADLSRNVLSHGHDFAATNGGVLEDPRVSVFVNDGRQHLRMVAPATYDLITLEPPPLPHAGVAALYSTEFYELARSRLTQGGFLTQWLPVEQLQGPETLALVRAFVDVFPNAVLLSGERRDLILMGSVRPAITLDLAAVARRLAERPRVAEDLARVDLARPIEIAGAFVAGPDALRRATAGVRPVTDDAPSMEYSVMSKLVSTRVPRGLFDASGFDAYCPGCASIVGAEDLRTYLDIVGRLYASDAFLRFRSFASRPVEIDLPAVLDGDTGARAAAILRSGYLERVVGVEPRGTPLSLRPRQLTALEAFVAKHPESALASLRLGLAYLASNRPADASPALARAAVIEPTNAIVRFAHALSLGRAGRAGDAVNEYHAGLAIAPRDVSGRVGLVDALIAAGRVADVPAEITRILELDPANGHAFRFLCISALQRGAEQEARDACQRAYAGGAALDPRIVEAVLGQR